MISVLEGLATKVKTPERVRVELDEGQIRELKQDTSGRIIWYNLVLRGDGCVGSFENLDIYAQNQKLD